MRKYATLLFPISIITFSSSLFLLVEKILLANISIKEMEVAVLVAFICQVFQLTCVSLSMMAQVNIAQSTGEKNWKAIGPGTWQFIWFSFISIGITIPIGLAYGGLILEQAGLKSLGFPYLAIILSTNFLYPLGTTLSCFYLGQGKTRLVVYSSIASQLMKLICGYVLILGYGPIPSMGLVGAALSSLFAQGGFCILLFVIFFSSKNNQIYDTRNCKFRVKLFWTSIKPGLLRAANRILCVTAWMSTTQLMSSKGGDYLVILSIGGAIFLFIPFLADAICQTHNIVVSQILGSKKFDELKPALRSGLFFTLIFCLVLVIPFIWFPTQTCNQLFPSIILDDLIISKVFFGIWVSFSLFMVGTLFVSYILAFKDMVFSAMMGGVNWVNGFLI